MAEPGSGLRLGKKLESLGPVQVTPVSVSGKQFWRVRVGPIAGREAADRVVSRLKAAGHQAVVQVR